MNDVNIPAGYKNTDVGVIPEDWNAKKLGDIAIISSGGTPSRSNPFYWNGDIPWITTTQINFNTIFSSEEFITKLGLNNSSAKLYDENTLLMAMYGQGKTRGKVAILGIKATINQACASIQIKENSSNQYIFFYLSHQYEEIRKLSNTGNQENLNGNLIKTISIPLPPLPEQKAIARVLSDVDELIRECDSLLAKKRDIKQGTMQQLLTGKKRLPGFSGEWEEKKLGDITNIDVDNLKSNTNRNYSFKYISLEDVERGKLKSISECVFASAPSRARRKVKINDVLVATVRPNLQSHLFIKNDVQNLVCSTGFSVIRCDPDITNAKFIYHHFFANIIETQFNTLLVGSNYPAVNSSDIKNLKLPIPTLPEQRAIAEILSDMDAEIEALEQKRDKYKAIKQGMMQELLTGKTRLIENG